MSIVYVIERMMSQCNTSDKILQQFQYVNISVILNSDRNDECIHFKMISVFYFHQFLEQ